MERFTTDDGLEIAYATWGSIDTGVPVVLHHGFAASHQTNWVAAGMVDALTAAGHSVVALDARGHGESDHPHDPALYGESLMSIDVIDLVGVPRHRRVRPRRLLDGRDRRRAGRHA